MFFRFIISCFPQILRTIGGLESFNLAWNHLRGASWLFRPSFSKILYYFECFQRVFHANGSKIPIYQFSDTRDGSKISIYLRTQGEISIYQLHILGTLARFQFTNSAHQGRQRDFNLPSDTRGRYKISIYQLRILWTLARFQFTNSALARFQFTSGRQQDIYRRTLARFQFTTGYYQVGKLKSLQYPKLVN